MFEKSLSVTNRFSLRHDWSVICDSDFEWLFEAAFEAEVYQFAVSLQSCYSTTVLSTEATLLDHHFLFSSTKMAESSNCGAKKLCESFVSYQVMPSVSFMVALCGSRVSYCLRSIIIIIM